MSSFLCADSFTLKNVTNCNTCCSDSLFHSKWVILGENKIHFGPKLNRFLHLQANINGLPVRTNRKIHPSSQMFTTADQMDSSMSVYSPSQHRSNKSSPVPAVQSWAGSRPAARQCTEPQHMHYLRSRMNYISCWLSYPDFKRPLAPFAFTVVSSRGAAGGDRRKRHKHAAFHTNLWWIH